MMTFNEYCIQREFIEAVNAAGLPEEQFNEFFSWLFGDKTKTAEQQTDWTKVFQAAASSKNQPTQIRARWDAVKREIILTAENLLTHGRATATFQDPEAALKWINEIDSKVGVQIKQPNDINLRSKNATYAGRSTPIARSF